MAALEEQILSRIENRLETILIANGFLLDVADAFRALDETAPLQRPDTDHNFIEIRHMGTDRSVHIRGAYECFMTVKLIGSTNQSGSTIRDLQADILELLNSNIRWNDGSTDLADRSWVTEVGIQEPEAGQDMAHTVLTFIVKFYEDAADPSLVKEI